MNVIRGVETAAVGGSTALEKRRKRSQQSDPMMGGKRNATKQPKEMGSGAELVNVNAKGDSSSNSGVIQLFILISTKY